MNDNTRSANDFHEIVDGVFIPITRNQFNDFVSSIQNMFELDDAMNKMKIKVIPNHIWQKPTIDVDIFNEDAIDGVIGRGIDSLVSLLSAVMHDKEDVVSWWFFDRDLDVFETSDGDYVQIATEDDLWSFLVSNYVADINDVEDEYDENEDQEDEEEE